MLKLTYTQIINEYKKRRAVNPDRVLENCKNVALHKAIKYAALAIDEHGKKHPHQYRRKKLTLKNFANALQKIEKKIYRAETFDELHSIVSAASANISDIGSLTIYDTAVRIGANPNINLSPEVIYLHAGTRKGAEGLLRRKLNTEFIEKSNLPKEFRRKDLSCEEIVVIVSRCQGKGVLFVESIEKETNGIPT